MVSNKWGEIVEKVGECENKKNVRVVFHNECREEYEVGKNYYKDGCGLKNRKTRSVYSLGYLDYDKNTPKFDYIAKERQVWKHVMRKYSERGITYKPYCSFVEFCKALRKHKAYDKIINDDSTVVMGIGQVGEIFLTKRYSHKNVPVKRINTRTGRVIVFENLECCANAMGMTSDHLRKIVNTDRLVKGCKLEYIE